MFPKITQEKIHKNCKIAIFFGHLVFKSGFYETKY